jgi:hypothetical protein
MYSPIFQAKTAQLQGNEKEYAASNMHTKANHGKHFKNLQKTS